LEANNRFNVVSLLKLPFILKKNRFDLIHTHLPRADFAGILCKLFFPELPWICSIHDIYSGSWSARKLLPLMNRIWNQADGVIAISHAVKNWLITDQNMEKNKVVVIHYGVETDIFDHFMGDFRSKLGLNGNKIVGTIGRLEYRKGHETLIRAMDVVCKQFPQAMLLIAGPDTWGYAKILHNLIDKLKLNNSVHLLGFVRDIPSFLHAIDIFAFATFSEGFGQVIIEAMAAGKPIVASNISPVDEIVLDRTTGLLAGLGNPEEFARSIVWLLKQPNSAKEMGRLGALRVRENFNAERMTLKTFQFYQEIMNRSG
jgi:glycosyltransferase involved in cell wall biosynthesis